ncbi:alcohol dehydrogenase [Kouleothrix aurantiaca]|uniref:Alcohol dehydrogenase n=1 Tax=Kouleothrix aurantiaca TaxID=186479 RepID=A0A0P9CY20_9CHLR|nr:alcohol dehydrogenase [Kouleothrix aurantiaca]
MLDFFSFQVRPRVLFRAGALAQLGAELERLGARRALIVADRGVADAGLVEQVQANIAGAAGAFYDVPAGGSVAAVAQGTAAAHDADVLVAVGGGSAIDTAKAIRLVLAEGGALRDHHGAPRLSHPLLPLVAIPTTAGSGSEVSAWALIRDDAAREKLSFAHPALAPDLAILDPELLRSLPPQLTAATGMQALAHAIEALAGSDANPISDILALQAIDMISNNLRDATYDGDDMGARGALLIGACIAGMAFSSSGGASLGMVHAAAQAIDGAFGLPHSMLNSVLLPYGMQFNSVAVPNRFARIARYMGVNSGGRPEEDVIADGIDAVRLLAADCGLPSHLRDLGLPEAAIGGLADATLANPVLENNPRALAAEQLADILHAAW